jgi:predicted dehydrogenase
MKDSITRRDFIKSASAAGMGLGLPALASAQPPQGGAAVAGRVGIIGLDTSHSVAFTKLLNAPDAGADLGGYRVVAAYPKGSPDIESSVSRVPGYTAEVQQLGVQIVDSIPDLLKKVDVVLLETNDGRPHPEQAMLVLKAGKRLFIDKPVAASLAEVIAIYEAAQRYKVPVFSSSSLRYMASAQAVAGGKVGKVFGADAYSPAHLEKTHPDLFWYGIHGVETLYTVMGRGCKSVVRVHTESTDVVVGTWADGRVGTFRGTRSGKNEYGGTAFGENGTAVLGPYDGYRPLLVQITGFFRTGVPPVPPEETLEMYAFMEAADESKRQGGVPVTLDSVLAAARNAKK